MMKRIISVSMAFTFAVNTLQAGYLDRLKPVLELRFDKEAKVEVEFADGVVLTKPANLADSLPKAIEGPHKWTGKAWDFSTSTGPYLVKSNAAMARVGDIKNTDGMSFSFWVKGERKGAASAVLNGPTSIYMSKWYKNFSGANKHLGGADMGKDFIALDNQWHNVVFLADFKKKVGNARIYLDGKLAGTGNIVYNTSFNFEAERPWLLGAWKPSSLGFDGAIANLSVFDRPLSDDEINYIVNGPVYAGKDQEVIMPNIAKLKGFAPAGERILWKQIAGPKKAMMKNANKEEALVKFTAPGNYIIQLTAGKNKSEIKFKVLPNQPPKVLAGDGIVLNSKNTITKLQGIVEDSSVSRKLALTSKWTVISAPRGGAVKFANSKSPVTAVKFTGNGLYKLCLSASDGELSDKADVDVLVSDGKETSYVQLLRPLFFVGFDKPAMKTIDLITDDTGSTGMMLRSPEKGMPVMKKGARAYTGYAWDFSNTESYLQPLNGTELRHLHYQKHPGRSISYWVKSDSSNPRMITNILGWTSLFQDQIQFDVKYMQKLIYKFGVGNEPLDGQWHHLVNVITSANKHVTRTLYLNGKEVSKIEADLAHGSLLLGSDHIGKKLSIGTNYIGQLDDFAVFDYALTPSQIDYLYNGPNDVDKANLKLIDDAKVDAGRNHYVQLPASYEVKLEGKASEISGFKPQWEVFSGNGTVSFSNPNALETVATFKPVEDDKDRKYSKFVLKLSLVNDQKKILTDDYVTVLFYPKRAPKIRKLSKTPPPGEHPRIYFTKADLPELRYKASSVPVAKRSIEVLKKRILRLDRLADSHGSLYHDILEGREYTVKPVYGYNQGGFFATLTEAAYVNWIGENAQSDTKKLKELAKVFSGACKETLTWYVADHTNPMSGEVNWAVGFAYDLLHNYMDEEGKGYARHLCSRLTSHRYSIGGGVNPQQNSSNWKGYHDHLYPPAFAIEGEKGFDAGVIDSAEAKNSIFLTQYGVFHSGFAHEGYGYFGFGMHWMSPLVYAVSRRDDRENLAETTRFYQASVQTAFRLLDKDGIRSHHDVMSDTKTGAGFSVGTGRQNLIAKYLWPDDPMIDYVWAKLSKGDAGDLFSAFLAEPVKYPGQTLAQAAGEMKPTIFCPDRGFMMARDKWDEDAIRLDFRCRMDKYELGHVHADCNAFEMWANNRMWFIDRGKKGGTVQESQSGILIDGIGSHSMKRNNWPSTPGKFVEFKDDELASIGCGDAKPFYDFAYDVWGDPNKVKVDESRKPKWSDYYFPREGEKMPEWMNELTLGSKGHQFTVTSSVLYEMNPVQRAFRTASLVKGEHPFVLIIDDFQKDDKPHEYQWFANVPFKGCMEVVKEGKDSLVLKHKEDANGPFMLVKVLNTNGLKSIKLNRDDLTDGNKYTVISERLEIIADKVVAPDFQILLYSYKQGDPMPKVSKVKDGYKITIGDQIRNIKMMKGTDSRTKVKVTK